MPVIPGCLINMTKTAKPIPTSNPSGALIGFENLLTASTTVDAEKALVPNTWERWRPPSGSVTVKFQMSSIAEIDFIAIAAHALRGETFTLQTAETVGGATTDVEVFSPTDNSPIMVDFDARTVQEVIFTGTLIAASEIGVIYAGKLLRMPRAIYGGNSPSVLVQKTSYQSVMSDSGQFLGRNITKKGTRGNFSWQFLEPDFYRDSFQPFVQSATLKPFFISWRPDLYSKEIAFGQTTTDIKPSNMGSGHRLMSVDFSMKAHSDL